jgi:hypothetical protein
VANSISYWPGGDHVCSFHLTTALDGVRYPADNASSENENGPAGIMGNLDVQIVKGSQIQAVVTQNRKGRGTKTAVLDF